MYWIADYCVGFIGNWGVHHLDIAGWGCPEVFEAPFEIEGTGFLPKEGMCSTVVTWQTVYRYPSGLRMSFTSDRGPFDWQKSQGLTEECLRPGARRSQAPTTRRGAGSSATKAGCT